MSTTVVGLVLAGALSAAAGPREPTARPPHPPTDVVASAEDARVAVQSRVALRRDAGQTATEPGTLPLLFVGSLLLGLAAAVRRTS